MKCKIWLSYDVDTRGQVNFHRFYQEGHSIKCKWTAFTRELEHGGNFVTKLQPLPPYSWTILEDSETRKVVKYNDRYLSHTVFRMLEIDVMDDQEIAALLAAAKLGEESDGEYCTIGECIATGKHLTDCDDDGFCNYCGEQDPCDTEKQVAIASFLTWTCGCGTVNGVNLATCRVCGRREGEL
jgi:hypothetical protein